MNVPLCQVPGGGYNNAMINIGGHFTRCHMSVNMEFTNLCSRNQSQHLLKCECYILLEIQMMNFKRMLNLETMLKWTRSILNLNILRIKNMNIGGDLTPYFSAFRFRVLSIPLMRRSSKSVSLRTRMLPFTSFHHTSSMSFPVE